MQTAVEILKIIKQKNLNVQEIQRTTGINSGRIYKWLQGISKPKVEDSEKLKKWAAQYLDKNPTTGQESAQNSTNDHEITKSTDKLTTATKAPDFQMKANGTDKDATIKNQSDAVKTMAQTALSQQETISKLTDLVTKLVRN